VQNKHVEIEHLPSQTALTAAAARAAHLIVDQPPRIFTDSLAVALLGQQADEFISYHRAHGEHPVLSAARAQATCRSRYTEDRLAEAAARGITQYVILGAGLDSFAYRAEQTLKVHVFEVDHPATQEWKRKQLAQAGIPVPDGTVFVPTDFEHGGLTARLCTEGFDPARPALVSWLGVTMYLTQPAISRTLAELAAFAPGTELITDYMLPAALRDQDGQSYASQVAPIAAQRGEPWLTCLTPDEMSAQLTEHGFGQVRQISQRDSIRPQLWARSDTLHPIRLSMLAHATLAHATSATSATSPG
jgi:methyltransferase (TIGR00027 family)